MATIQRDDDLSFISQVDETLSEISPTLLPERSDTRQAIDINALARKVYALLMKEAQIERERRGRSTHWEERFHERCP